MGEALAPGQRLGHYTIEAELGRGPLGISYRARDAAGETVALKVLASSAPLTDAEKADIARDFHALEDLASPQIPVLLEFVRYDHLYVIATDYLPLGNLERRLERGPLALPAALTLIRHLAYAVGRAHAAGVVHGGIKPTNVLRREVEGRQVPVLSDFGGGLRAHPWIVPEGAIEPTRYRAPELGHRDPATPAADVFALGMLLGAMTGASAPADVRAVIARATDPDPANRYASANDLLANLAASGGEVTQQQADAVVAAAAQPEPPAEQPAAPAKPPAAPAKPGEAAARLISAESLAAVDRGYRSKLPIIVGVAALAVAVLVITVLLSGKKGSVFNGATTAPGAPVVTASPAYRAVAFSIQSSGGDASVVEVLTGRSWKQIGTDAYTKPTAMGGQRACATFRIADESQTPAVYGPTTQSCGTSAPPTLGVKRVTPDCDYGGYVQVCYVLAAGGYLPGSNHTLTLSDGLQTLGTVNLTADSAGYVHLPPGLHFHFSAEYAGRSMTIYFAGRSYRWTVASRG